MNASQEPGIFPALSMLANCFSCGTAVNLISRLLDLPMELAGEVFRSVLRDALRGRDGLSLFFLEDAGLCVSLKGNNFSSPGVKDYLRGIYKYTHPCPFLHTLKAIALTP